MKINFLRASAFAGLAVSVVVLAYAALQLEEGSELPISGIKGAISLTIDVTYDADVDAVALPKEGVEYVISD